MMIVAAAVKRRIKEMSEVNVAGDLVDKLNVMVDEMLERAVSRCRSNGRKTVRADDL